MKNKGLELLNQFNIALVSEILEFQIRNFISLKYFCSMIVCFVQKSVDESEYLFKAYWIPTLHDTTVSINSIYTMSDIYLSEYSDNKGGGLMLSDSQNIEFQLDQPPIIHVSLNRIFISHKNQKLFPFWKKKNKHIDNTNNLIITEGLL